MLLALHHPPPSQIGEFSRSLQHVWCLFASLKILHPSPSLPRRKLAKLDVIMQSDHEPSMTFGLHRAPPTAHHPPKEHSASNAHREHSASDLISRRHEGVRVQISLDCLQYAERYSQRLSRGSRVAPAIPAVLPTPRYFEPDLTLSHFEIPIPRSTRSSFKSRRCHFASHRLQPRSSTGVTSTVQPSKQRRKERQPSQNQEAKKSTEKRRVIRLLLRGYTGSDGQSDAQHERIINVETL